MSDARERDVLDAFAMIGREILRDLRLVVGALVDGDADPAAGAGHRLGAQPRELALDVEIADLTEVEEVLVELGPKRHAALVHVVGEVIDAGESHALGRGVGAGQRHEIDVVDRVVAVAVDQIEDAAADSLDRGDVELHRPDLAGDRLGAEADGALIGARGVAHAEGDGAD